MHVLSCSQHCYGYIISDLSLLCSPPDECVDSSDCSHSGVCVDTHSTNIPRRQCFCYPGYHGPRCHTGEYHTSTCVHATSVCNTTLSQYHLRCEISNRCKRLQVCVCVTCFLVCTSVCGMTVEETVTHSHQQSASDTFCMHYVSHYTPLAFSVGVPLI